MTVAAASVTVTTMATLLSSETDETFPGSQSVLVLVPAGGATVYLGGEGVTTAAGFPLAAGESFTADLGSGDVLYGIVAASTQAVSVLRSGV